MVLWMKQQQYRLSPKRNFEDRHKFDSKEANWRLLETKTLQQLRILSHHYYSLKDPDVVFSIVEKKAHKRFM